MKKIFLTMTALVMSQVASAKYMGLDSVAMPDEETHIILSNAVKSLNTAMLDKWRNEKGSFYLPYSGESEKVCYVNPNGKIANVGANHNFRNSPKDAKQYIMMAPIGYASQYPLATKCEKLPMLELLNKMGVHVEATPTALSMFGYKREIPREANEQAVIANYLTQMIEDAGPEQWDQLLFVIINKEADYKVRMAALEKFKKIYPDRMQNASKNQLVLLKQGKGWYESGQANDPLGRDKVESILPVEPVNYMAQFLLISLLESMQEFSKKKSYQAINSYSRSFWDGKKDVNVADYRNNKKISPRQAALMFNNMMILREIMKLPDFNLNFQNENGNTYLHVVFNDPVLRTAMSGNKIFADFMRSTFEKGLNPMLLNKKKETPYMLFEKSVTSKRAPEVFNAFMLEDYPE